jgi:GNAT superfamily N-acetyltransferase
MSATSFEPLTPGMAEALGLHGMTFPAYRRLLSLQRTARHPENGDKRIVQPLGVAALAGETARGLALAEQPVDDPHSAEVLSLYVHAEARNAGVGTALLERLEAHLGSRGINKVSAVYTSGRPGIPALERVLAKRGWSPPVARAHTVHCTPDGLSQTPWFARVSLRPPEFEIFPWTALTDEERQELMESHTASPWIAKGLEPWGHDHYGFDPTSSIGLRYRGTVVGWVINHRIAPGTVRFTCSFMRADLARRGRIYALYTESILKLQRAGCQLITWVVPVYYGDMVAFLYRRCAPWMTSVSVSYGSSKPLAHVL